MENKCKECGRPFEEEKKGIKIFSIHDSEKVLFESSAETLRDAKLECANLKKLLFLGANTEECIVNFIKEEYAQAKQFIEGLK